MNESNLTGEPVINKTVIEADFDEEATYASNLVMRGTTVVDGHGTMRVLHVGDATEIGKVARQSTEENLEPTPLNIQLTKLANLIGKIGFTVAGLAFLIFFVKDVLLYFDFGSLNGWHEWLPVFERTLKYFMMAVTLIVVAVPEGLPMSVTLSLALNMRRMLSTNNLVRKMHACETMGAITVICTDKTGTLTQNLMQVHEPNFYGIKNGGNLGDDDISALVAEGSAPTQPLSSKKRQRARSRKVSVTLRKSPCYYGSTVREEIISNSVNTPASSTSSPSRPNVNLWRLSSSLRSSERKYFI